eukprot:11761516-Ditylum_brightwellii.AAC.1
MQMVATVEPDSAHTSMERPDSSVMSASVITWRKSRTAFSFSSVHEDGLKLSNTSMSMKSKSHCVAGRQAPGTMMDALQHLKKVLMLPSQDAGT